MKAIYRLILGIVICSLSVVSSYGQFGPIRVSNGYSDNSESYDVYESPFDESRVSVYFANFDPKKIDTEVSWYEDGKTRYSKVKTIVISDKTQFKTIDKNDSSASVGIYDYKYLIVSMPGVPDYYSINDVMIFDKKLDPDIYIKNTFFIYREDLQRYIFTNLSIDASKYIAIGRWTIAIPTSYFKDRENNKWLGEKIKKYGYLDVSVRYKNNITNKFDVYKSQFFNDIIGPGIVEMECVDGSNNGPWFTFLSPGENIVYSITATSKRSDYCIKKDISNNPLVKFSDNDKGIPLFDYWKQHLPDRISPSEATEELFWKSIESDRYGLLFKGIEKGFRLVTEFEKKHYVLKLGDVLNGAIELDPSSGNLPYGTEVRITAIPNDNCKLSAIYINGKPVKSNITKEGNIYRTTFTIEENTVVSAEFVSTIHNITKKPSVNGKYTLSQELNIPEGSEISVTATPDEGYVLDKVIVNGKAIKGTTFVVDNDCTVEVVFKKRDCFITCTIDGDGRLEISPNKDVVPYGTEITVNPIAGKDFILEKLLVDGKMLIDRKVVVTKNVEIFASFIRKPKDMLNVEVLNPVDGKIFARNATTGEYYTGNSEIRANTLLLLKIEYDKNKYDFGGFTFDGKIFDGYQLRIERKGILSALLKPKSEYSIRGAINIETSQNGTYTITTPDKYIDTEISVIDIMGRVISKHKIQSNITTIDLSTQHSGILLLKFNDSVKKIKHRRI